MIFNLKMFEPQLDFAVVKSLGYESILRHSHEFVEIVYVESGTAMQNIGFEDMNLSAGDIFVIAGNEEHSIRPTCEENDFKLINIIFNRNLINIDYSVFNACIPYKITDKSDLVKLIYESLEEYDKRDNFFENVIVSNINRLLACLARFYSMGTLKKCSSANRSAVYVARATTFIQDNFRNKLSLDEIAKNVGLTSGYLQKIFRVERKTSVIEYLLRYRMEQACKLLMETNLTVTEISNEIGFSDIKNFHYLFKKVFGVTPNEYRLTHGKDNRHNIGVINKEEKE